MKAFQVTNFEKTPTIEDIQTPTPKPDQIRLKIMSCGLNFADILLKNGTYQETPPLPFVLGMEVSGVVDALGSNVTLGVLSKRCLIIVSLAAPPQDKFISSAPK